MKKLASASSSAETKKRVGAVKSDPAAKQSVKKLSRQPNPPRRSVSSGRKSR